ncbi:MAG TPA: histidine phosphatase family protein [Ktedonobacterales bacterium]|jgi:broad specificity phosphatase PhoE|nr:histidine phosphatase family protein [Ktedonobacterales bacterium]
MTHSDPAIAPERRLLLIRHAAPLVLQDAPAREWPLSDEGRLACEEFAERLVKYRMTAVLSSAEMKARETAAILAARLGLAPGVDAGLNEHRRENVPYLGRSVFEAAIRQLFVEPDTLVFGQETATQAYTRFAAAVERALVAHPDGDVALVTHGTVMTLYAERHAGVEPFAFWLALTMPDLVALAV